MKLDNQVSPAVGFVTGWPDASPEYLEIQELWEKLTEAQQGQVTAMAVDAAFDPEWFAHAREMYLATEHLVHP